MAKSVIDRMEQIRDLARDRNKDRPPRDYAAKIIEHPRAERAKLIENVPEKIRCIVSEYVTGYQEKADAFARNIAKLETKNLRRQAFHLVPIRLQPEVKAELWRLFASRNS